MRTTRDNRLPCDTVGVQMDGVSVASVVTGLVSGVISSALTYFSTRSKIRLDLTVEYDKTLHEKRLDLYQKLWPETKGLARFVRATPITYKDVKETAVRMLNWYFDDRGGIYLSKRSRTPYFDLHEKMQLVIDNPALAARPDDKIPDELRDSIFKAGNHLRTSLADDIGTRRAPWL